MLIPLLGSVSCNKTQTANESINPNPKVVLKTTNSNVGDLLRSNSLDKEDEAINIKHLNVALVLKNLSADKEFVRTVLNIAKENKGKVRFNELYLQLPRVKSLFDEAMSKTTTSITGRTGETITYQGYIYSLVIFVPNYEVALDETYPIVSPGFVEYDDIPNDNPDIVFAWQTAPDGSSTQVLVGEKEAMAITQAVMLPSLETIGDTFTPEQIAQFQKINKAKNAELVKNLVKQTDIATLDALNLRSSAHIDVDQVRIHSDYGYETSKHSEFTIDEHRIDQSTVDGSVFTEKIKIGNQPSGSWHVKYIHFSELGSTLSIAYRFADFMPTSNIGSTLLNNRVYVFNTYERDWYNLDKDLGTAHVWGKTIIPSGRRKYKHEWYTFVPTNDLNYVPIAAAAYVWGNATITFSYPENDPSRPEKGKMRFSYIN